MSIVLPMVKESQTSGGTGNLTGCSAVSGFFRGDTSPGGAIDRRYKYWILEGSSFEWGIGYKSATGTFVRETVLGNSSGTTSAINFTSAAEIISMAHPGVDRYTVPAIQSASGDGICMVTPMVNRAQDTANSVTADELYLVEGIWWGQKPITELGIDFPSATASSGTLYVGVYAVASDGGPGELLCEGSTAYSASATGITTATISGAPLFGACYAGFILTSSENVRGGAALESMTMGWIGSVDDAPYSYLHASITTPSAMPDPVPSLTAENILANSPEKPAMYWG